MLPGLALLPRMVDRRADLNPHQSSLAWIQIAALIGIFIFRLRTTTASVIAGRSVASVRLRQSF
jgi:hypothetical protein